MNVDVLGWDRRSAVALVDGVRVRVRRSGPRVRWMCDRHGSAPEPHCPHLEALAATPPPPEKHRPDRNTNTTQEKSS